MEFRVVNYVGILFSKEGDWHLTDEDKGEVNLSQELRAMSGGKVQVTIQHAPPDPPDKNRWGGGCCMWEATGRNCPCGHHERPGYLYSVAGVGEIRTTDGPNPWYLSRDGQKPTPIYFGMLEGHRCRFVIVPSVNPDDVADMFKNADPNNLGELMERAEQLKAFIAEANKVGKKP